MNELVKYLISQLVDDGIDFTVDEQEKGNSVEITVTLPQSQMGRVIGKQGKIAKAIRTVVKGVAFKTGKKYTLEICEK